MKEQKRLHRLLVRLSIVIILGIMLNMIMIMNAEAAADRDVIIGFNKSIGPTEKAIVQSYGGVIKKSFHLIPAIAAKVPDTAINAIRKEMRVAYVENDSIYMAADEYMSSWGVQHIGTQSVHNQSIYGDGVNISVLDTGIDYNHPEFAGNYKGGYDFVFNDTDPWDDNCLTFLATCHGTHVSGIVAAANNGVGMVGVAPNASLYAVKVLDGSGRGFASWIISGIQWAVDNNMDIASMSIEGYTYDEPLRLAVENAYNAGVLLIAAGGNTNGGPVLYPAAYDRVIAVTAINDTNQKASFSPIDPKIELAAPGVNIYSTVRDGYGYLSGTSMSTPYVTGVAALIIAGNLSDVNGDGRADNKDVRQILDDSAKDLGTTGRDSIYGYGMVDAQKAVLGTEYVPPPPPPPPHEEPFVINLTLVRTKGPEIKDAKNVSLLQGNYSIKIKSINLTKIEMKVYENGTFRKNLSSTYKFNKTKIIETSLNISKNVNVTFVPYGDKNTVGYVTIKRL